MGTPFLAGHPRRVLVVSHHGLPHIGGVEVLVDQEIRALTAAGREVTHVTSDLFDRAEEPHYAPSVHVLHVPAWHVMEGHFRLAYPIYSPRLLWVLWREVGRCDAVHAHGFVFLTTVAAILIARLRGKACQLTDHGGIPQFRSPVLNLLMRLAALTLGRLSCRLAHRLVAYNLRVLRDLERLAGTREKSLFLPYPIDPQLFRPISAVERASFRRALGWTARRPKVLFVGRITPDKGVLLLLAAKSDEFDLIFSGPGNPEILGLPRPGVTYLPPRPREELVKLYQAADLVVLPSYREGFPLVVREALACGAKVVMSWEEGYTPYRGIANLSFCALEPESIRAAILEALTAPRIEAPHDPALNPTPGEWVARLYDGEEPAPVALRQLEAAS